MKKIQNLWASLPVSDFERSLAFYDVVMAELGFLRCNNMEANGTREAEYCFDEYSKILSIMESPGYSGESIQPPYSKSIFPAKSRSAIDAFYISAIANGASEISKPSLRQDESYTASVLDPDGHNIEAVCRNTDN